MPARQRPEVKPRRWTWTRYRIAAVVIAGALAVFLIANTHPWTVTAGTPPTFELKSLNVTFAGSGSGGVKLETVCQGECPVSVSAGSTATVSFTVAPVHATTGNCSPAVYYTITKVSESSSGAFQLTKVTADSGAALPVTLPDPLGGKTCVTTVPIWVSFNVVDQGTPVQTPTLTVSVTQS